MWEQLDHIKVRIWKQEKKPKDSDLNKETYIGFFFTKYLSVLVLETLILIICSFLLSSDIRRFLRLRNSRKYLSLLQLFTIIGVNVAGMTQNVESIHDIFTENLK